MREIDDIHIPFLAWLNEPSRSRAYIIGRIAKAGSKPDGLISPVAWMGALSLSRLKGQAKTRALFKRTSTHLSARAATGSRYAGALKSAKRPLKTFCCDSPQLNAAPVLAEPKQSDLSESGEARESKQGSTVTTPNHGGKRTLAAAFNFMSADGTVSVCLRARPRRRLLE